MWLGGPPPDHKVDPGAAAILEPCCLRSEQLEEGRIVFPALIPGAAYRVVDATRIREGVDPQVRKEFTVKPGETLDLGEIRIEKPQT